MSLILPLIAWLGLATGAAGVIVAYTGRIGASACLLAGGAAAVTAVMVAEGEYGAAVLVGSMVIGVPAAYWQHVRVQETRRQLDERRRLAVMRAESDAVIRHEISMENIAPDELADRIRRAGGLR